MKKKTQSRKAREFTMSNEKLIEMDDALTTEIKQKPALAKFSDIKYTRPEIKEVEKKFEKLLSAFDQASSADLQNEIIAEINKLRNDFATAQNVVSIRHTIDTTDPFYEKEQDYFDQSSPVFEGLTHRYY